MNADASASKLVDEVLLVGGSTRIPAAQALVRRQIAEQTVKEARA
jgi:molecular chaperone DnaK (HSP70)